MRHSVRIQQCRNKVARIAFKPQSESLCGVTAMLRHLLNRAVVTALCFCLFAATQASAGPRGGGGPGAPLPPPPAPLFAPAGAFSPPAAPVSPPPARFSAAPPPPPP